MSFSFSLTDLAAFWGAFSGTLAVLLQILLFYKDRVKIELLPQMVIRSSLSSNPLDSTPLIDFNVDVVNNGRRVAFIEEVGIRMKGKFRLFSRRRATTIQLFSAKDDGGYKQINEGQKLGFEKRRWIGDFIVMAENMGDKEKVYVKLTSGAEIEKAFGTICMSKYETQKKKYGKKQKA